MIEILVLSALARRAQGAQANATANAAASLQRAVAVGQPEGYARLLADEGAGMAASGLTAPNQAAAPGAARRDQAAVLPEPLRPRELEGLRLIARARELGWP